MSNAHRKQVNRVLLMLAVIGVSIGQFMQAQSTPYQEVEGWAQLPEGIRFGAVAAVQPDAAGNIWVLHRADPPILKFSPSGKLLTGFGNGMFIQAHGLFVDREGNVWVTDAQGKDGKGHQVFKFSPEGKILMTLGKAGVAGQGPDTFNGPCDLVVAANGDIFVVEGHGGTRVVKFSKDGTFLKAWGTKGSGPGEFEVAHTIAIDASGRLYVGDRNNARVQIFDQEGRYIDQWKQLGRPTGVFIAGDLIYVADETPAEKNPGFGAGFRVGSIKDASVKGYVPAGDAQDAAPDAMGNVYVALQDEKTVKKYAPAR